jgi:tetratricopeptide (TPR) repeat protein
MVQLESLVTSFDRLEGVANRGEFAYPLKSPLVFHEMFLRSPGVSSGVEEVRTSLEERLGEDDRDFEAWEQLGHVWRHYGNVPRTIDCYRKALSVLPLDAHAVRSSLHINLAGLLDQMNFVSDALVVLHTFLDAHDVTTYEAENNFAVGYMMVSQLELRAKRLDAAEHSLAASLQLQPRLRPAVMGVQKELKHWRKVGGSSSSGGGSGGSGSSSPSSPSSSSDPPPTTVKDPWIIARLLALSLQLVDLTEAATLRLASRLTGRNQLIMQPLGLGLRVVNASRLLAARAPRVLVIGRKLGNALPCVVSGLTSRAIAELGWRSSLEVAPCKRHTHHRRAWPVSVSLTLPLLLGHAFSLLTDFMIVDCLVLLFVGGLLFPLVAHSTETRVGPLSVRIVKA